MNKFQKWLIENYGQECWDLFKREIKRYRPTTLTSFFYNTNICIYILGAFAWEDTKNGAKYWIELNSAWQKHLDDKK